MSEPSGRILVIDDDPEFSESVRAVLECKGHRVFTAKDGAKGLRLAARERPEVVIVDLLMVPEDGFAVCDQLRRQTETREAAIMVASAIGRKLHKDFGSLDVGTRLDADAYLTKPVDPDVLAGRVDELLQLARSRAQVREEEA